MRILSKSSLMGGGGGHFVGLPGPSHEGKEGTIPGPGHQLWELFRDVLRQTRPQHAVLKEWEDAGQEDGYVLEELGECLLALDREEDARRYFTEAYEELSKDAWLVANEAGRLERLKELGRVSQ